MKRSVTRDSGGDAALRELERALDAFMATHLAIAANSLAIIGSSRSSSDGALDFLKTFSNEEDQDDDDMGRVTTLTEMPPEMLHFQRDVKRLLCLSSVVASTRRKRVSSIVSVGRLLLAWLQTVESSSAAAAVAASRSAGSPSSPSSATEAGRVSDQSQQQSPADPVASWLVATLLKVAFQKSSIAELSSSDRAVIDELVASAVGRCLLAFQRAWQADEEVQRRLRAENSGTLFSYFTMRKAKPKTPNSSGPPSALAICLACTTEAANAWGHVMGLAAGLAPDVSRLKLQKEIIARASFWNAAKPSTGSGDNFQHPYLKHLAHIRLGLAPNQANANSALASRMADAVRWLRIVMPLLLKPHRSHVRCACAQLVAQMLIRELHLLTRLELSVLYTCTGSDWSRCISDLHAAALRLTDCAKKKSRSRAQQQLESASWSLRVVVLALAPGEIFTRYWHEDALALLRLQYHLNQDSNAGGAASYNVLPSLELGFTYMMHRHFLLRDSGATAAGAPSESDCMEIINTTQAWGFFSLPRLRPSTSSSSSNSFTAFRTSALPALVHISQAIASYNTAYTVQSHLRRLLAEPVGIGDPQKLIGLEALAALLSQPRDDNERDNDAVQDFRGNDKDLLASRQTIGELVGRVLLECSTRIGHRLLTEIPVSTKGSIRREYDDVDEEEEEHAKDPTRSVSVTTFAAALGLMPSLYAHLSLSGEQKLLLLVRASVNAERVVHRRAHETLLALIGPLGPNPPEPPPPGAVTVVRALTDYIMRMYVNNSNAVSDAAGAIIILRLLSVILEPTRAAITRWERPRAKFEALIQVEAIAVYLLARGDDNVQAEQLLRLAALDALEVAHEARVVYFEQPETRSSNLLPHAARPSVWTLLKDLEPELQITFFSYGPNMCEDAMVDKCTDKHPLENLHRLVLDTTERQSFRWSHCLTRIFKCLARRAPDVTAYIWADVADKVAKLEPVIAVTPSTTDYPQQHSQRDLARWRNLALLATTSASPMLHVQTRKTEASTFSSESSSPSSSIAASVAPSSMVASLVRQLACYLRSTNIGQRNAAVMALGNAGTTALPTVLDVLARYEGEAFVSPYSSEEQELSEGGPTALQRSRSMKTTKLSKKKLLEMQHARMAQLTLQWAIGRCYRLLLDNRTREQHDDEELEPVGPIGERLRHATSIFLAKMVAAFEGAATSPSENSEATEGPSSSNSAPLAAEANPSLAMVQFDFVASLRALLLHSNAATKPTLQQLPHDKLASLLLSWCGSFDKDLAESALARYLYSGFVAPEASCELYTHWMSQCDVFAARDGKLIFPWIWVDNQHQLLGVGSASTSEAIIASRKVAQYFVCHRAFSTLAELLRSSLKIEDGPTSWDGDSVVAWLDSCFSVDAIAFPHFSALHQLAQRALHALLELPPGSARFTNVVKRCLEKATCASPSAEKSQLQVARQYLTALGASAEVMSFFQGLLLRLQDRRVDAPDKDGVYLAVQLLHVLLLHVGVHQDDGVVQDHRQVALDMVAALVCAPDADCDNDEAAAARWGLQGYYSPRLEGQVAGRLQVTVSALLASKFPVLSLRVSLAILRSMPLNAFQNRDDTSQQRQMLAAVLPWLAEVPLWTPNERGSRSHELLELVFGLTSALGENCSDQLDHIWLTLAFASSVGNDSNLREIVRFLFRQQQQRQLPSETAKTVMWWLCRWQDAAADVLRLLLLQLPLLATMEVNAGEIASALDDLGALVMLASDTSCHLLQSRGSSSNSNADVRALAVHLMHISLTTIFALHDDDSVDEIVSKSVTQHCHVLLHSVLPLLEAPRGLLAAALALIEAATSTRETASIKFDEKSSQSSASKAREQFLDALRSLALCLSAVENQVWSDLCVRELALAISLNAPSTLENSENFIRPSPPHEVCVRFALVEYTQLAPSFQGDVLLSTLTLLRQTLTAGVDDRSHSLARECLALLVMLTGTMPISRLVLYPQVVWVAFALLTHSRQQRGTTDRTSLLHHGALELLATLWDRTPFMTHGMAQDLIRLTRPVQWGCGTARSSMLLEIVRCLYTDENVQSRQLAMKMLRKSVLLIPHDLLGVSKREHLMICTLGLLPAIAIPLTDMDENTQVDSYVLDDLAALWEASNGSPECDQMVQFLHTSEIIQKDRGSERKFAAEFVSVFVPALLPLELGDNGENAPFNGLALSLEVFVVTLPQPAGPHVPESLIISGSNAEPSDTCGDLVFVLLEEFLLEVQRREDVLKRAWRPLPELEAALARLLRSPRSERHWRASVRVLSCVAEISKSSGVSTGSPVSPLPVSPAPRRSLPGGKIPEMPISPGDSEDAVSLGNSKASHSSPMEAAEALTLKKSPSLLRLMAPRSRSSDSITRSGSNKTNIKASNNNEPAEPPTAKGQHLPDQPVSELEDHVLSSDIHVSANA